MVVQNPFVISERRQFGKRIAHTIRRGHLYLGLCLFPWAILYGVSAFLFNHPTAFSEQPTKSFEREALTGTPLEGLPTPTEQAEQVVKMLNDRNRPPAPYRLAGGAVYSREFAFATVKADGQSIGVLVDLKNGRGTVRSAPPELRKKVAENAPFHIGESAKGGLKIRAPDPVTVDAIRLDSPLQDRVKAAIPTILERTGFPGGDVTVTSVPDLVFPLEADGRIWTATYSATAGSLSGKPAETEERLEPSVRRFLTRLHSAHGYPGERDARWYWAILVDVMALALCFWGLSGLFLWSKIKSTRWPGAVVLILSTGMAMALGLAMYSAMRG